MCGNEVLHVAAQRNCFERWERPAFFRKQSLHCDCKLPYFYKKLCTCFCYLFIVIRNAFKKKKKKKDAEVDIRKKRGKNKNGKYTCKNVMH